MLYDQIQEAVTTIQAHAAHKPVLGLILGSGLGELANQIEDATAIPYTEIPHFVSSTVSGHSGRLLIGTLEGTPVIVMQGRVHLYEGYDIQEITFPVRVMKMLGAQVLIVTNAAGGVNPIYRPGDFMLIQDHINMPGLAGHNPLIGPNDARLGTRFPPLAKAYDRQLLALASNIADSIYGITLHQGVYTMVAGPSFETGAELRYLRAIGTDAVGMSTVPEVIVARHMEMKVLGISLITNTATGSETEEINHGEVLATADSVSSIFEEFIRRIIHALANA